MRKKQLDKTGKGGLGFGVLISIGMFLLVVAFLVLVMAQIRSNTTVAASTDAVTFINAAIAIFTNNVGLIGLVALVVIIAIVILYVRSMAGGMGGGF
jgi:predicted membrane protein